MLSSAALQEGVRDNKIVKELQSNNAHMSLGFGNHSARIFGILGGIAMRCWALAGAAVLACLLLYWAYGGILAFLLLCFATTGKFL